ncbi:MAG TPA: restriction endonuclease subunit S [Solirubrobacteraceae bacterium]|jgi:type I restriction enzyme S subunit
MKPDTIQQEVNVRLADICEFITKGATPTTYGHGWQAAGILFLRSECVAAKGLDLKQSKFISKEANYSLRRSQVVDGDLLMTITGNVGRVVLLDSVGIANINQHIARIRIRDQRFDPDFIYHYLSQEQVKENYDSITTGQAYPQLSLVQVRDTVVKAPPINEQRVVAASLNAADSLIAVLGRMIVKKETIKQGMMQRLLTSETRLPGFIESWREVTLGDVVSYVKTVAISRARLDTSSPLRYLHYGDIHTSPTVSLDAAQAVMPHVSATLARTAGRLQIGDLVLVDASEDQTGVGKSVEVTSVPRDGIVPGLHTIAARFDKAVIADGFKAYLQFIPAFRAALLRLAAGTKVLATTRSHISSVVLSLPNIDEQRAIAGVLRGCDAEIEALYARLAKARAIKQGMMQELLTGRTRLPVTEAVAA